MIKKGVFASRADNGNVRTSNPCVYVGGNYNQNQNSGLFYTNCNSASNTNSNRGSRIQKAKRNPVFRLGNKSGQEPLTSWWRRKAELWHGLVLFEKSAGKLMRLTEKIEACA